MATAEQSVLKISMDRLLEGVQIIGFDWTYLYLNDTAARQGGRSSEDLLGRTMTSAYPGIENTELYAVLQRVMRTRQHERLLNEFSYPGGKTAWFELLIEPVPDGLCVFSLEVSDRLAAEQQLQQAQKMEAVGQLAGGVVHDFNNMLTAILGYADLIAEQIGPETPASRDLQEITAAGERAAALTRQLLAFSRKHRTNQTAISLNVIVERIEPMLRRLISENIKIRLSLDRGTHAVWADRIQIEQILINLVVNARDAMVDGGVLTIATRNATLDQEYVRDHTDARAGEYAVLSVTDTGIGMAADVRDRIFEPFFTTKGRGHGTGLGLAGVRSIVTQLRGHILVYSEPGHGAVFKIYLPKTDQPVSTSRRVTSRATTLAGTETILLVEDDSGLRSFARKALQRHGYQVHEASNGESALAMLASGSGSIDLLVTDVVLPGIDGTQLARRMARDGSAAPVLFMSGYADPIGAPLPFGATMLEKPFTAHELLAAVRQALG